MTIHRFVFGKHSRVPIYVAMIKIGSEAIAQVSMEISEGVWKVVNDLDITIESGSVVVVDRDHKYKEKKMKLCIMEE